MKDGDLTFRAPLVARRPHERAMGGRGIRRAIGRYAPVVLLLIVVSALLFSCQQREFDGSRIKSTDTYRLDIHRMNGSDRHTLDLKEGDALYIRFETEQGSMYMEIKAPDGTAVYQGNGTAATTFTVNIKQSGVYTIALEAKHAKGVVHVRTVGGEK